MYMNKPATGRMPKRISVVSHFIQPSAPPTNAESPWKMIILLNSENDCVVTEEIVGCARAGATREFDL